MGNETISHWVEKAKNAPAAPAQKESGVQVVRREPPPTTGQVIMDIADKLWPGLMELFHGMRDSSGMLLQPAHVRGIALNMAQELAKKRSAGDGKH